MVESDLIRLLDDWSEGKRVALSETMPLIVDDPRRLAGLAIPYRRRLWSIRSDLTGNNSMPTKRVEVAMRHEI